VGVSLTSPLAPSSGPPWRAWELRTPEADGSRLINPVGAHEFMVLAPPGTCLVQRTEFL
jgi:hypothetical protein